MMTGLAISLLVAALWIGWLWRSGEIQALSFEHKARNLVIWAIIIAVLAFVLARMGL